MNQCNLIEVGDLVRIYFRSYNEDGIVVDIFTKASKMQYREAKYTLEVLNQKGKLHVWDVWRDEDFEIIQKMNNPN